MIIGRGNNPNSRGNARKYGLTCSIDNCDRPHRTKGYCNTHSEHLRRYGTPHRIEHRKIEKNCLICKKTMIDSPSRERKLCSYSCVSEYKKGKKDKNLTYSIPKGTTPWNKNLVGFKAGEQHHNWRGGVTTIYKSIRTTSKYAQWRRAVFIRDNYTCQECLDKRGGNLNADHIKPFSFIIHESDIKSLSESYKCEELWDINNGRTLCEPCHIKTPTFGRKALEYEKA